jgi:hypothetical protein
VVLANEALTHMMALRFLSIMSAVAVARAYNNGMAVLIPPPCLCVCVCMGEGSFTLSQGVEVSMSRAHASHAVTHPSRAVVVRGGPSCGPLFVHRGPTLVS